MNWRDKDLNNWRKATRKVRGYQFKCKCYGNIIADRIITKIIKKRIR